MTERSIQIRDVISVTVPSGTGIRFTLVLPIVGSDYIAIRGCTAHRNKAGIIQVRAPLTKFQTGWYTYVDFPPSLLQSLSDVIQNSYGKEILCKWRGELPAPEPEPEPEPPKKDKRKLKSLTYTADESIPYPWEP